MPSVPQQGKTPEEASGSAGTAAQIGINCDKGVEGGRKSENGEGTKETREIRMNNLRSDHRKVLLLVEDDDQRAVAIKACIPPDIHCVWAKSAGAALGVLRRDKFSGIMLDFDLDRSAHGDPRFNGESVAAGICETQGRHCEIFVHSRNPSGARRAFELLKQSGFSVEQCPWSREAGQLLKCWLEELSDVG